MEPAREIAPPPRPWAIMTVYAPDGAELRRKASINHDTIWEGRSIATGWLVNPVVIAATGVGYANAAAATQHIIDRYNPVGIIVSGIATPINPAHVIGDVVIPDRWITYDFGLYTRDRFVTDSVPVGGADPSSFRRMLDLPVDTLRARQLRHAADRAAFRLRTVARRLPEIHQGGVGVSGNAFVDSRAKRDQLRRELKAEIADTESAAIVQTATAAGIPVVVMRSCAAPPGEGDSEQMQRDLHSFFQAAAYNNAIILATFLETVE